ncbi:MAG: cytochrome C biogenesis protein, partial [Flavobacteriia bacterium]|nr:cytochrome C biogenesis protein [Flavobacteriia bacterium]
MRDTFLKLLFSNRTMAFLVLLFPTAMALGTFIESWYNIETARIWIYNAWWFEAIMVLLALNFAGNIFKYKLLRKEKWAVLLLHLSFILILFGAFVTRYFGYEGVMPIREGETTSAYLTEKTYLTVLVDGEIDGVAQRKKLQGDVLFSAHVNNSLQWENEFDGTAFTIDVVGYIEEATEGLVLDENGDRYLKIVEAGSGTRHDHYLKEGDVANIHNVLFTLNNPIDGAINISAEAGLYYLSSPYAGNYLRMADQQQGEVVPQEKQELALRSLYT